MANEHSHNVSSSDPSATTSEAIDRRVENSQRVIDARIEGMEKAVNVFQADLTRVPTQLDRAISSLKELEEARREGNIAVIQQRLDGMDRAIELFQKFTDKQPDFVREQVLHLRELHESGFESIKTQFILLKQATEQLDLANKTAIAAALQAQKESAAETQKSSQAAIAKSEASTSEAIKALTIAFNTAISGATDRINDLKSRLDRGEGKTSVSDPETMTSLRALSDGIKDLARDRDTHRGATAQQSHSSSQSMVVIGIIAAFMGSTIGVFAGHFLH